MGTGEESRSKNGGHQIRERPAASASIRILPLSRRLKRTLEESEHGADENPRRFLLSVRSFEPDRLEVNVRSSNPWQMSPCCESPLVLMWILPFVAHVALSSTTTD